MLPTFDNPQLIVKQLPPGFSIEGYTAPTGERRKEYRVGSPNWASPIIGLPHVVGTLRGMMRTYNSRKDGEPLIMSVFHLNSFGEGDNEFFLRTIYDAYQQVKPKDEVGFMQALHQVAVAIAGDEHANDAVSLWLALDQAGDDLQALDFGPVFTMGHVLTRWVNRPLVPFPAELSEDETSYYKNFIIQAKADSQANNLIDVQAMRMYEGYGARLLVQRVIERVMANLDKASSIAVKLQGARNIVYAERWELLSKRIELVKCFLYTMDNIVGYQAILDLVRQAGIPPNPNPVLGTRNTWEREELMKIARKEIDNAVNLRKILLSSPDLMIETGLTPADEN